MPNIIYNSFSQMNEEKQTNFENMPCRLTCLSWRFGNYMGFQAAVTMSDDATIVSVFAEYLIHRAGANGGVSRFDYRAMRRGQDGQGDQTIEEGTYMTNVKWYHRRLFVQGCVVSLRLAHLFCLFAS